MTKPTPNRRGIAYRPKKVFGIFFFDNFFGKNAVLRYGVFRVFYAKNGGKPHTFHVYRDSNHFPDTDLAYP